jgi:hypothetical protein
MEGGRVAIIERTRAIDPCGTRSPGKQVCSRLRLLACITMGIGAGLVVCLPAAPAFAAGTTLYVAQAGTNTGTCRAAASPCATVTYALSRATAGSRIEVSGTIVDNLDVSIPVTIEGAGAPAAPAVLDAGDDALAVVKNESGNTLALNRLTIENDPEFGGVLNDGTATITDSTVSGNFNGGCGPFGSGGGITNDGTLTVVDSTVTGNNSNCGVGGIANDSGSTTVIASTISGNGNHGEGGISGNVTIGASIVSGNNGPNCAGTLTSLGYNLTDDATTNNTCGFSQPTDLVAANPELGPLADNGGPTPTLLPQSTSPAIGVIPTGTPLNGVSVCPRVDQRGLESSGDCTIGSVEPYGSAPAPPAITSLVGTTFVRGIAGSFTVTATGIPAPTVSETGKLPGGVTFNSTTDVLSGTPTAAGTFHDTFTARNGVLPNAKESFTLKVVAIEITTTSLPNATHRVSYRTALEELGGTSPFKWKATGLPSRLTLAAKTGVISGKATTAGTYTVKVTLTDSTTPIRNSATATLTLVVN